MMLRPTTPCTVTPYRGADIHGEAIFGDPFAAACGVVKIASADDKTSVRADSSATRGYAEEVTVAGRLLFAPGVPVGRGDKIELLGMTVVVVKILPRIDLDGQLDHNQVDVQIWA